MNSSSDYVHPLARNFSDFLRLILACGDTAAIEQAWMWDELQFQTFLRENPATQEQKTVLQIIAEAAKLTPMDRPWAYIHELQSSFDSSKIRYTDEFCGEETAPAKEPVVPAWKVYFDGSFWGHQGTGRTGKEIQLGKQFDWAGYHWVIPAAYSCSKGLVLDFCMRVEPEAIRAFMKKWDVTLQNDTCENFSREQQMQIARENPLCFSFRPRLTMNGKELPATHGSATGFNPWITDEAGNDPEVKRAMAQYGLDRTYGWVIYRNAFSWQSKRRPAIHSLSLTMAQRPEQIPGPHFTLHAPGDTFAFSHPISGTMHTLTVQEIEQQTIPQNQFASDRFVYPTHCTAMTYTLSPEPDDDISVFDCNDGDRPREVLNDRDDSRPSGNAACFVGVICSLDGPAVVSYGANSGGKLHTACSSLHFEPVQGDIAWYMVFHVTRFAEDSFRLIILGIDRQFFHRNSKNPSLYRPVKGLDFLLYTENHSLGEWFKKDLCR